MCEWQRDRQRRAVALEIAVGPVAVVLQLEEIALEIEAGCEPVTHLDRQRAIRREHSRQAPIFHPLGIDTGRQHPA